MPLDIIVIALIGVPLLSIPIIIVLSKLFRREYGEFVAIISGFIELVLSIMLLIAFIEMVHKGTEYRFIKLYGEKIFFNVPVEGLGINLLVDLLSVLMSFIVVLIGCLVLLYSKGYMHGDKRLIRYYSMMLLFIGGMLLLVLSGNFFTLYLGWEIVGLCSCLLIGHWYERPAASKGGIKAFVTTRLGDVLFLAGIAMIAMHVHSLEYTDFIKHVHYLKPVLNTILLLALGGAIGKSAQFPLHVWLKDAMEGPTTVSAILHSATMVKAGVFLVARIETLLFFYPRLMGVHPLEPYEALAFLSTTATVGAFTAMFAATMAIVSLDIKELLAFSTISQLGYMLATLGLAGYLHHAHLAWYAAIFHVLSHALFKALLFLSAGCVIHAVESRDMRLMGGLKKYMPITFMCMTIGALSLAGLPPLSGFWSKDVILEVAIEAGCPHVAVLLTVAALMTATYSLRLVYLTFLAPESDHVKKHKPHEAPYVMTIPLIILAALTLSIGLAEEVMKFLEHTVIHVYPVEASYNAGVSMLKILVTILSIALLAIASGIVYMVYWTRRIPPEVILKSGTLRNLRNILLNGYYLDYLYENIIVNYSIRIVGTVSYYVERGLDLILVRGTVNLAKTLSNLSGIGEISLDTLIVRAPVAAAKISGTFTWMAERMLNGMTYLMAITMVRIGMLLRNLHTGRPSTILTMGLIGVAILLIALCFIALSL